MVVMNTSYKKLKKELKLSTNRLKEVLSDIGMELKDIDGDDVSIELTAERTDMLSTQGLIRALKMYTKQSKPKEYDFEKSGLVINVDSKNKEVRPCTVAAVVKNLKLDEEKLVEIIDIQEKLHQTLGRERKRAAIGVYPYEKIKGPINFTCDPPSKIKFIPLEFNKKMDGNEIIKSHPAGVKYGHLLEGLKNYPYFVDSKKQILSIPPIINSQTVGRVIESTKELFIEVSGSDIKTLNEVLIVIVTMLEDMGGKVYSVDVKYKEENKSVKVTTPILEKIKIKLDVDYVNKTLGLSLKPKEIVSLLERMMHKAKVVGDKVEVCPSPIRSDIWHSIDLVDDVARAHGFNNIKPKLPKNDSIGETNIETDIQESFSNLMVGAGYQEIRTFGLTSLNNQISNMNLEDLDIVRISNSSEMSINCVRRWLLPEGLTLLKSNAHKKYPQKVFECGVIVVPDEKEDTKTKNEICLSCLHIGTNVDYSSIGEVLNFVSKATGVNFKVLKEKHHSFIEGRCGKIMLNNKKVGIIGELHPKVLNKFSLVLPVVCFELNLSCIQGILK